MRGSLPLALLPFANESHNVGSLVRSVVPGSVLPHLQIMFASVAVVRLVAIPYFKTHGSSIDPRPKTLNFFVGRTEPKLQTFCKFLNESLCRGVVHDGKLSTEPCALLTTKLPTAFLKKDLVPFAVEQPRIGRNSDRWFGSGRHLGQAIVCTQQEGKEEPEVASLQDT